MATSYQVQLEVFEGPLDLLLHLIEKAELDITKVSLARVTDQYLEHIKRLRETSAEYLADFLVVAAKLLLIKSRALLPAPPPLEEEKDAGDELARQLIEYKRFKEAALQLRRREAAGLRTYLRVAPPPRPHPQLGLSDITLVDLVSALQQALEFLPPLPDVNHIVTPLKVSVDERIEHIRASVHNHERVSFTVLLRESRSRLEIIVTFLALLELIKRCEVLVQQDSLFGEIIVTSAPLSALPPTPEQEQTH